MSNRKQTGAKGEQIAVRFLEGKGYKIIAMNWHLGRKEVDIIALQQELLVFVEVKTRKDFSFGFPEEAVTKSKEYALKQVADGYLTLNPHYQKIRFDIISIILKDDIIKEIRHIEDAFF